jgi:hypothetical protein
MRRATAGLGLFALLLQLVLSFGHIHARDLMGTPSAAAPTLFKTLQTQALQTFVGKASPASEQEQIPGGRPDDDCPICMIMHMAASGLLPTPPSAIAPSPLVQILPHTIIQAFNLGVARHSLFQTRAPPTA